MAETKQSGWWFAGAWVLAVLGVMGVLAALVAARDLKLSRQSASLEDQERRGPVVIVTRPLHLPEHRTVTYPADVHGYFESPIYPKVSGYVTAVLVDKGMRVKQGQLLATVESPELDQQVRDAYAAYQIALITDQRNQILVHKWVIPQQTADESHSTMHQTYAQWQSLKATQGYERVIALYDGVITARNVDPGALVAMQTAQTTAIPIVAMATLKPVRVYLQMTQDDAAFVKDGDPAVVTVTQLPRHRFTGRVTRHPSALMNTTRTMLVEVDLPNDDLLLYPGMYAHVQVTLSGNSTAPLVPDDALVFKDGKTFVPIVRDGRIHLNEVTLGFDDGIQSQVTSGLTGDEMVILSLGQSAREGAVVQPRLDASAR